MDSISTLPADFPKDIPPRDDHMFPTVQQATDIPLDQFASPPIDLTLSDTDNPTNTLYYHSKLHPQPFFIPPQAAIEILHSEFASPLPFDLTLPEPDCQSVDDSSTPSPSPSNTTTPPPQLQSTPSPSPSSSPQPRLRPNVSHTRRCRAKLNTNFDRLLQVLPKPPPGVEVKHKAQILQYAIDHYRHVRCKNVKLEMTLALSSRSHMHRWVQSVVHTSPNLRDSLKSFMAMICLTKNWKYAELWSPHTPTDSSSVALTYASGALPPTVEGEELHRLKAYRVKSRKYTFAPRSGVPGRVFLTMRPEWLPLLNDPVAFPRAPHAVRNRVEVTFAVPVVVNGSVKMVVQFYDTYRRDYEPATLNMTNEIAAMFGKAFTAINSSPFANTRV
ncbi:hypothetical protein BWQ96_02427 [Gracilariopsis chorda]|uniref:BHLH domain-containing protein n=1 Tax=Gracilariopsis chorda TaxID=448386 RepID=A0A2V3J090_9FLOR|nr:hypothetical protein BWQ96_02427 [Gracilariopsis chorda]|eukprot:PXF47745.1 hypothetical protein BWQ96_02427 [Gracilariopsis chorda]